MVKLNKAKTLGALYAVAMTAIGTGCATTGQSAKQPWEKYDGFLAPNDPAFEVKKEALQNEGKAVEATFVPDENGNMVAVYGVRQKTWIERTNDHLNANEGIYKNVDRAANLGLKVTDTVYNIKGYEEMKETRRSIEDQNRYLRLKYKTY